MRASEAVGIIYFVYLSLVAAIVPLPGARRFLVWVASVLVIATEIIIGRLSVAPWGQQVRDWLPAFVILLAYFATGLFYVSPSPRFEAWLRRWDDKLIGGWNFDRLPWSVRCYLEVIYDLCFLMIPAGYAVLAWTGRSSAADRFWTLVSAAEFLAFATLPWLQARPPWAIEPARSTDRAAMRRFSLSWVKLTTIRANTFPSGHASASLAVALALWPEIPPAAAVFGVLALSIAAASVVGRFHYAIDAVAGVLLALALAAGASIGGI
jgi:membrane-associated phospholipid phosphatase